jgi:hypothetical protein
MFNIFHPLWSAPTIGGGEKSKYELFIFKITNYWWQFFIIYIEWFVILKLVVLILFQHLKEWNGKNGVLKNF